MKVNLVFIFCLFFLVFPNSNAYSEGKTKVVFAGFAINAEYSDLNDVAKYTWAVLQDAKGGDNVIDKTLANFTENITTEYLDISYLEISKSTSKIAMAVFLDQEIFEVNKFEDDPSDNEPGVCAIIKVSTCYYYKINNQYQIIFFDFEKMNFIYSIPFDRPYTYGPIAEELDDKKRKQLFKTYYSNENNWLACPEDSKDEDGIQALINIAGDCKRTYAGILKDRKIKKFYNMYLGINPAPEGFEINESKTKALIPEKFIKNPNLLKRLIGNYILGEIGYVHAVPIVPYISKKGGYGIGNVLQLKFANQNEAQELELPIPDYYIDLYLRGLIKKEYKKDANVENLTWWIYGAGLNIKIYGPLKEYLNVEMTKAHFMKIYDFIKLNKINDFANILAFTLQPLSVEFAEKINSDFKNKEDKIWLEKITKKTGNPEEFNILKNKFNEIATSN